MPPWNDAIDGNNVNIHYESARTQSTQKVILPPRLVTTLYGRADVFIYAIKEIECGNPVTLHGMAGMGKSALASAIAWSLLSEYPNGVLWVDGGYNPIDAICDNVGQQFEDDQMPKLSGPAKPSRVRFLLGAHKVLVILDDCWDADVAREFAQTCVPAGNNLIVTSREKIAKLGTLIEIPSLAFSSGADLFRDAAGISNNKHDKEILELVQLLGGHPQGLSIAGALCLEEELSAREILKMLGPAEERARRLKLGKDASNNVWATFELSYQRLRAEEQIIFKAFSGAWAKSATSEMLSFIVLADSETIENALRGLVKRALARAEEVTNGYKRYVVHDLIHAFIRGLVKESGQSVDETCLEWLAAAVKYAEKYKDDNNESYNALEAELGNLLGAANWGADKLMHSEVNTLAHTLCSSSGFLYRRGYNSQAVALSKRAVESARKLGNRKDEGIHLGNLGYAYALLSNYPEAIECYQQALEIARAMGDRHSESKWLGSIGLAFANVSKHHKAIEYYKAALDIDTEIGNKVGEGRWLGSLAGVYRTLGDGQRATELYAQAIELARKLGDKENECVHLSNFGNAYRSWGKYEEAIKYYDQALSIALEIGDRATQARSLVNAGRLHARMGAPADGLEKCRKALEIFAEIGFRSGEAYAHGYIGEVMRVLDKKDEALKETSLALALHREIGVRSGESDWLHNLGVWAIEDDDKANGIAFLKEALNIRKELGTAKIEETLKALKQAGIGL